MLKLQIPLQQTQRNESSLKQRLSPTLHLELSANPSSTRADNLHNTNKILFPKNRSQYVSNHKSHRLLLSKSGLTLHSPQSFRKATPRPEKVIGSISNFFNKTQITTAIQTSHTVPNRIKTIDLIIQRRIELKKLEEQLREDRAKPLISKLQQNFRKRRLKKLLESDRKKTDKVTMLRPDIEEIHFRRDSLEFLNATPMPKILESSRNLSKQSFETSNFPTSSELPVDTVGGLDDQDGFGWHVKHEEKLEKYSEKLKMFLHRRSRADKTPHEGYSRAKAQKNEGNSRTKVSEPKKTVKNNKSIGNLSLRDYLLASTTLERDLFKFVTNQKANCNDSNRTVCLDVDSNHVLLDPANRKNGWLKGIERGVEKKIETCQREQNHNRHRHYLKGDSITRLNTSKTRLLEQSHTKPSPQNITPSRSKEKQIGLDRSSPTKALEHGNNKLPTMLLTEEIDEFKLFLSSKKKREDGIKDRKKLFLTDDSIISYSESKLDYLYKVTSELEDNLKLTNKKILNESNQEVLKTLQQAESSRRERLASLRREIYHLTKKKIT